MVDISLASLGIFLLLAYGVYLLIHEERDWRLYALCTLVACCLAVELFDLLALYGAGQFLFWKQWDLVAEALLPSCFLGVSLTLYRQDGWKGISFLGRGLLLLSPLFLIAVLLFPLGSFFYAPDFPSEKILFLGQVGYLFYLAELIFLTYALVQVEKTLRALPRSDRWRAKFEILGLCAILAIFLFYYSQALLYRSINMGLLPVRSLTLAVAGGMMIFSRWRRGGARKIRLSPEMAFRSVAILAVGIYLVGLGLSGVGMRYLGVSFPHDLFVSLAFLAGLALVTLLLSDTLRRKVRVFLHKHFYTNKYDYRVQWLQVTDRLAGARNENELQMAILSLFADTFCLRGAALYLADGDCGGFRQVACFDMAVSGEIFRRDEPFVSFMEKSNWVINVGLDKGLVELVGEERMAFFRHEQFSCLVPLQFEGHMAGLITLGAQINEGEKLIFEDYDLMKMLARQATAALLSLRFSVQLAATRELAAIGRVSAFVLHDLKNLVSGLALVAENARDYMDDPEFQADMLGTLTATVGRMKGLIQRLKNLEHGPEPNRESCDLNQIVLDGARQAGIDRVQVQGQPVLADIDPVEMRKVVLNLVLNALEASPGERDICLEIGKERQAYFRVTDQGAGMTEDFVQNQLFKPFATTKQKGFGVGLYQCRNIVEAHGGRIEVVSEPGRGSCFTVWLPLATDEWTPG